MVVGDLNTNLAAPEGWARDEGVAATMSEEVLEDMIGHFLQRNKLWLKDGRIWAMHRGGREVRSRTDYILGIDSRLFQNVVVRDARHNKDHYLVLGCLRGAAPTTY